MLQSRNPYGFLVNQVGICRGYASTFQLFMDLLDISVEDLYMRSVLALRFANGFSWLQVAMSIGGHNTADSVEKTALPLSKKRNVVPNAPMHTHPRRGGQGPLGVHGPYGQELAGAFPDWARFDAVAEGIAEDKRRAEECDIFGGSA